MKNKRNICILLIIIIIIFLVLLVGFRLINDTKRNYEIEKVDTYNFFVLYKEGFMGVIDNKGNTVIEPVYDMIKIPNPAKAVFVCYYNYDEETDEYETKVLNDKKEEILTQYNSINVIWVKDVVSELPYEKSVLSFQKNGKYGLIDFKGKEVVKPIYDFIESASYKEGELLVKKEDKYGIINIKGKVMIDPIYDVITSDNYYSNEKEYKLVGYIVGNKTGEGYKYGYINYKGKMLLELKYNKVTRLTQVEEDEHIYIVYEENGQAGLIKNKEVLLRNEYQSIEYDSLNQLFVLQKNKQYGVVDKNKKNILLVEYDEILIDGIYIYAKKDGIQKVFNVKGQEDTGLIYNSLLSIDDENYYIIIDENGNQGVLDHEKKPIIPCEYLYVEYLLNNYFVVCDMKGQVGIKNDKNETVLELEYDVIQRVQNTNIIQTIHTKQDNTKLYSKEMKLIYSGKNTQILTKEEYIKVYNDTDFIYLDYEGNEISNIEIFKNNSLFAKKENGKWGFIDNKGNIIVDYIYDMVTDFNRYGFAGIKKDGMWGILDFSGKVIVEPKYKIDEMFIQPDFIGKYYKTHRGINGIYYTDQIGE